MTDPSPPGAPGCSAVRGRRISSGRLTIPRWRRPHHRATLVHPRRSSPRPANRSGSTLPDEDQNACGVRNCNRTATGPVSASRIAGWWNGPLPAFPQVTSPFFSGGWGIRTPEGLHPTRFPIALTGVHRRRRASICAGQRRWPTKNMPRSTAADKRELLPKLLPERSRAGAGHGWDTSGVCREGYAPVDAELIGCGFCSACPTLEPKARQLAARSTSSNTTLPRSLASQKRRDFAREAPVVLTCKSPTSTSLGPKARRRPRPPGRAHPVPAVDDQRDSCHPYIGHAGGRRRRGRTGHHVHARRLTTLGRAGPVSIAARWPAPPPTTGMP